jgi:cell division protein FtsQ
MHRSLVGRPGIGHPVRTSSSAAGRRRSRPASIRKRSGRLQRLPAAIRTPFSFSVRLTGAAASFVWQRRRLRITLLALILATPLLAGGYLWLRGSSLVAVRHVQVSGVHGADARAIEEALTTAARRMSTLDVHTAPLQAAVAPFRTVREVHVSTSFPHGLRIHVVERLPVAALTVGATHTAVAADGVILGPALLSPSLPAVAESGQSATAKRVDSAATLGALSALGAAPAPLAKLIERAYTGPKGLTIAMKGGLLAYFGDGTRPHAKWTSLARVLVEPSSAGATYVDVRLPERPAAGFGAGGGPSSGTSGTSTEGSGSESTEALAAGLAAAVGGGSTSAPAEPAKAESSTEAGSPAGGEASSEEAAQASPQTPAPGG